MNDNPRDPDRDQKILHDPQAGSALPAGTQATSPEKRPTEATQDRPAIEAFDEEGAGVAAKE
jgi:hypothetical protein